MTRKHGAPGVIMLGRRTIATGQSTNLDRIARGSAIEVDAKAGSHPSVTTKSAETSQDLLTDPNGAKLSGFGIFLTGTFFNSRNRVEQDDLAYLTHMLEEFFKPPVIGDGLHEEGSLCL